MDKELFSKDKNSDKSLDSNNEELEKASNVKPNHRLKDYTARIMKIQNFMKTVNPSDVGKENQKIKISVPELCSSLNDLLQKYRECPDEKGIEENIETLVGDLDEEIKYIKVRLNILIMM